MIIVYLSHLHPKRNAPLQNLGGMQKVSVQWLEAFSSRGAVTIFPYLLHANWKGIAVPTTFFLLKLWFFLPFWVKRHNADVVVFSSMVTASLAPLLIRRIKVPMVAINHGLDITKPDRFYQWWVKKVFASLTATISVSKATRQACIDRGMPPRKAYVIPNGLPETKTTKLSDRSFYRNWVIQKYGLREDRPLLLNVGRQVRRKGHVWFIHEVLPLLKQPVQCLFVGEGPERESIEAAIRVCPGDHKLILTGKIEEEELQRLYAGSDLFIMPNIPIPNDMEGFGIVMLEANHAGLPVLATRLEGIVDVIREGVNGRTCEALQPKAFAEHLEEILNNPEQFPAIPIIEYVKQNFGWDAVADQYEHVLHRLILQSRS